MSAVDPIAPVVNALSFLVAPNPALPASSPFGPPSKWEGGSATKKPLYTPIQTLLGVLFAASTDINTVGKGVRAALAEVVKVVDAIADNLATLPSFDDAKSAMTALQS